MKAADAIHRIPLFKPLSPARFQRLLSASTMERYEKGRTIFHQGERAQAIWVVLDGWVHLVRSSSVDETSHAVVVFTITADEMLCGISAIDSGTYNVSAVVGAMCRALRIPGAVFQEALTHEPEFAYQVIRLCARRMRHIAQQYGSIAEPVASRIVRSILRLRQQFGARLPVTHRELAQMSWTTTETAIRMVRALKRQGLVRGMRGQLTIARPRALEQLLKQRNGHRGS